MRWLSDAAMGHLRQVADWPDLSATRYDLVEKIAQGGMASVYLARDRELDREVAVKVLSDLDSDPQSRARMVEEARIIARLEHPGIIPVHDSGVLPDGRIYFAMKLVRGQRLDDKARASQQLAELLPIFEKICQTVAFAHSHGVLHRDLKPQNIMVGSFGEVLVMDWGLAKVLGPREDKNGEGPPSVGQLPRPLGLTQSGSIMGTPGYMAPEQEQGRVDQIDERTDVYGLGAILYFLVTGQTPTPDSSKALDEGLPRPSRLPPSRPVETAVPRPLQAICLKALAVDRAERYQSVQALAKDIASFLAENRVEAYREGIFESIGRLFIKYRPAVLLVVAYLVVRLLLLLVARV